MVRDDERFGLTDLARIEKLVLTRIAGEFFRLPLDDDKDRIRDLASTLPVVEVPAALIGAARLRSGTHQDDIAVTVPG